jgi:hypothetical protein
VLIANVADDAGRAALPDKGKRGGPLAWRRGKGFCALTCVCGLLLLQLANPAVGLSQFSFQLLKPSVSCFKVIAMGAHG